MIFNNNEIKNILFDLGNVLLDTDLKLTIEEFKKLGIADISKNLINRDNENFYYNFEKGFVSSDDFISKINIDNNLNLTHQQFNYAWNKMLLSIKNEKIEFLKILKNKYKIYLLSNSNQIHIDFIENQDYWHDDLFDKKFYSHQMGLRKPELEIYKQVLIKAKIEAENTLFIDDLEININAAKELNFNTILYKNISLENIFI